MADAIRLVGRATYTDKAMAGLLEHLRRGLVPHRSVVFLHAGGRPFSLGKASAWRKRVPEKTSRAEAVVVIGASEQPGSLGGLFVRNRLASYRGVLYCVHPSRKIIVERPAYHSVRDLPTVTDLTVVLVLQHEHDALALSRFPKLNIKELGHNRTRRPYRAR